MDVASPQVGGRSWLTAPSVWQCTGGLLSLTVHGLSRRLA